jgi:galactokinase
MKNNSDYINGFDKLWTIHGTERPVFVRAPGRINLIGEHTDYNDGLAMPAAINRYIYLAATRRDDYQINLHADGFESKVSGLAELVPAPGKWYTYVLGTVSALLKRKRISGFNLSISGNIPAGAGLSSSAAICCATAIALDALFELKLHKTEMALIAREAEHNFAGVKCGLMDQYACLFGRSGYALKIDFRTMGFDYVPLGMTDHQFVLCDTGVKHDLAATEYNTRRLECAAALEMVQVHFPSVGSMREITMDMLYSSVLLQYPLAFKRARYVVEEIDRVEQAAMAMCRGNMEYLGRLLDASHQGLRDLYAVSCKELDLLQLLAQTEESVLGSRMMGGGFGGCTINLVPKESKPSLDRIGERYQQHTGRKIKIYKLRSADGASIIHRDEWPVSRPGDECFFMQD